MMFTNTSDDARHMQRALELAERGRGRVAPNPLVGAVVVRDNAIVGEGWHARFGEAHAEVMALRDAGAEARGATLYVTLEPCDHIGKTPPCTTAIVEAGIVRVVYAVADPNLVASGGASVLASRGLDVIGGVCADEGRELIAPFAFALRHSDRPFVTLKLAVSIDGAIVDASRQRGWLTGLDSRHAVHALRAGVDAIAVGIETVLADDPLLTVREGHSVRTVPQRIIFDRSARLPLASALMGSIAAGPVVVVTDGRNPAAEQRLQEAGAVVLPVHSITEALQALRARGVTHLLVEGGATIASTLMEAGFVDRLITFQAPVLLGAGALSAFAGLPAQSAGTAPRLRVVSRKTLGSDLMTTYAVSGE
jgi:diaminohydroxyphosphoribosylaminopyrimidine deaminase/5-amino-6-(5-phosphoribosylamino)uracil reductase